MKISINFNRFVFGVVLKEIRGAEVLIFEDIKIHGSIFKFNPRRVSPETMRELFKHLDLNYPRDTNELPVSYTKLTSKEMTSHLEWIVKISAYSGFQLPHVEEEWNRILMQVGIYK